MKIIVFGFLAVTLATGPAPTSWGNATSENGEVCLELPDGLVDWQSLAVASLGKERFAHPSGAVLRAGLQPEHGNTAVTRFQAAVPSAVRARTWIVFHSGAAVAVRPTVLRGHAVYFFNSKLTLTQEPLAEGTACAPWAIPHAAAFFASDVSVRDTRTADGSVERSGTDTFSIAVEGQAIRFRRPDVQTAGALHVTLFRTDQAETLALVEWDPGDGSTCGHAFTLLTLVSSGTRPPLQNMYDCDV